MSIGQATSPPATRLELQPGQSATLLSDGRILLLGGVQAGHIAQLIDPSTGQRTNVSNPLHYARAGHTATVLPDGGVLIAGGVSPTGVAVNISELYDPASQTFAPLPGYWATPRAYHTATLLTDGRLLIAGGVDDFDHALASAEIWESDAAALWSTGPASTARPTGAMQSARQEALATLLPDGSVLIEGGQTQSSTGATADRFSPGAQRFESGMPVSAEVQNGSGDPRLVASLPVDGATAVAPDDHIALRFSRPIHDLATDGLRLTGPRGVESVRVTVAEGGRLAFVKPLSTLQLGARYELTVQSAVGADGGSLIRASIHFNTNPAAAAAHRDYSNLLASPVSQEMAGSRAAASAQELTSANTSSTQESEAPPADLSKLPPRQAPKGITALAGQVLLQDGRPLAHVTLSIDDISARTDGSGRFLLKRIPSGHHELVIDGRTASSRRTVYGIFEVGVDVVGSVTTVLPYTIWMPALATADAVPISSPTAGEVVIKTPRIPGLELHLPAGTRIIDHDGNVAREIGITAIPVEKPPFPLPANVEVPVYFTIQPGAAYVYNPTHAKAWLVYPNYKNQPPGTRVNFWHYDPEEKGWYVYGQGTVTDDGKQVRPDPGVGIYEFTGAMISSSPAPPSEGPPPGSCGKDGDPVDCVTGLFIHNVTDLYLRDTLPISFTRVYRSRDTTSRPFGVGANHTYGIFLYSTQNYTQADLILPDGGRIHYVRTSAGTGFADAVYEHIETGTTSATPTEFYKSKLSWNGTGWDLTLTNGLTYIFGDMAPLQAIRDRNGNRIQLTWSTTNAFGAGTGNLTRITSPNGRWIALTYDTSGRITQAQDNGGRTVGYSYNAAGDLSSVTDANGKVTSYTYDTSHRLLTWTDPRNHVVVTNQYDATTGRVVQQTYADSTTNQFAYTISNGKVTRTEVTNERANVRRFDFNSDGYVVTDTRALGTAEQKITTYTRQTGANLITSMTDPLGHRTDYTYDAKGNVASITRLAETSNPLATSFTHDPTFSRVTNVTDPLNNTMTFAYDTRGNRTAVTDALNHVTTMSYNAAGQPVTRTDALNHTTTFTYVRGDLVANQNALGNAVTYQVDAFGRRVAKTDALGNRTRFQYDGRDRLTQVTDPKGGVTSFAYDDNGNVLSVTDPRSGVLSYTYDNRDRPATRTDALSQSESYAYDAAGNLIQRTERNGKISTFNYDALNRVTQANHGRTQQGQSLSSPDATVDLTWDAGDRLAQISDTQGGTITRSYNDANRSFSETTAHGAVSYAFDAAYRRASMTVAGQTAVLYSYDAANRLTGIAQGTAAVALTYDNANRRATVTLPNGIVATYSYDVANHITGIQYVSGSTTVGDLAYAYDPASRRTSMTGSLAAVNLPTAVSSASHDAGQRLTAWSGQALSYDNNGNLTADGTNTFTWDSRNRVVSANATTFSYDALDRRTGKTVSGTTANYLYDIDNVVQELSGGSVSANLLTGLGIDERFSRTDSAGRRTFLIDAIGSTLALADDSAAVQTSYTYEPYGATTVSGAASTNPYQFTGRENDGSGLYYYRARLYQPTFGRFASEDPIGIRGGINLYGYVRGNPISLIDPLGLADEQPNPFADSTPSSDAAPDPDPSPDPDPDPSDSDSTGAGEKAQAACDAEANRQAAEAAAAAAKAKGDKAKEETANRAARYWNRQYYKHMGTPLNEEEEGR